MHERDTRLYKAPLYRPEMEPHGIAVEGGLEPKPLTWMKIWLDQGPSKVDSSNWSQCLRALAGMYV